MREKSCMTCAWGSWEVDGGPCHDCFGFSNWSPKQAEQHTPEDCATCPDRELCFELTGNPKAAPTPVLDVLEAEVTAAFFAVAQNFTLLTGREVYIMPADNSKLPQA